MRISLFHKGVGVTAKLTSLIKILGAIALIGWGLYLWAYPTHAATLFDDDFEGGVYRGEWADQDSMTCDRGVALTTEEASHGYWSLTADRTGVAPDCTDQLRSELGIYDSDIVQVSFSLRATETDATIIGVRFSDSEDPFSSFGGVKISGEDLELTGGTTIQAAVTDNTWYRIDWRVDFTTGCQTARVDGGSFVTPECGITEENLAHIRYTVSGSVSSIAYLDNIILSGFSSTSGADVLPPEFDSFIPDDPISVGDVIADYPSHDDVYGQCDFWGFDAGDGLACVWTYIEYALVPESQSLAGLLAAPVQTLATRWPFSYVSQPINAIQTGLSSGECPFPPILGVEFFGSTLPEVDFCAWIDDASIVDYVTNNTWAEAVIIYSIYLALGLHLWRRAESFLQQN